MKGPNAKIKDNDNMGEGAKVSGEIKKEEVKKEEVDKKDEVSKKEEVKKEEVDKKDEVSKKEDVNKKGEVKKDEGKKEEAKKEEVKKEETEKEEADKKEEEVKKEKLTTSEPSKDPTKMTVAEKIAALKNKTSSTAVQSNPKPPSFAKKPSESTLPEQPKQSSIADKIAALKNKTSSTVSSQPKPSVPPKPYVPPKPSESKPEPPKEPVADKIAALKNKAPPPPVPSKPSSIPTTTPKPAPKPPPVAPEASSAITSSSPKPAVAKATSIADRIAAMQASSKSNDGDGTLNLVFPPAPKPMSQRITSTSSVNSTSSTSPIPNNFTKDPPQPRRRSKETVLANPAGGKDPSQMSIAERIAAASNNSEDRVSDISERPSSERIRSVPSVRGKKIGALQGNLAGMNMQAMLGGGRPPPRGIPMMGMSGRPVSVKASIEGATEASTTPESSSLEPGALQHAVTNRAVMGGKKKRRPKTKAKLNLEKPVEALSEEEKKKRGLFGFGSR